MPDQDNYALTLVAYIPETGIITHLFSADDLEFCESNAAANGCTHWILTSETVDPKDMLVIDGLLETRPNDPSPIEALRESMVISPRQLFIALASPPWNLITPAEATAAAVSGVMPEAVDSVVASLPELQQMQARVTWARMQEVRRSDPLVTLIASTRPDMAPETIDEFFAFAAAL